MPYMQGVRAVSFLKSNGFCDKINYIHWFGNSFVAAMVFIVSPYIPFVVGLISGRARGL